MFHVKLKANKKITYEKYKQKKQKNVLIKYMIIKIKNQTFD